MIKYTGILCACFAMTAGIAAHAEEMGTTAASIEQEALTADEQAFAAKLSDQNRKIFHSKLLSPHRKAVMVAVKNGANADLAVQNMLTAKEMKDANSIAVAE